MDGRWETSQSVLYLIPEYFSLILSPHLNQKKGLVTLTKFPWVVSQQPLANHVPLQIIGVFRTWGLITSFQDHQGMGMWQEDFP